MEDRVKLEFSGGILTCLLFGDIDHHAEEQMREKIDRALYEYRPSCLILDFSGVKTWIDIFTQRGALWYN